LVQIETKTVLRCGEQARVAHVSFSNDNTILMSASQAGVVKSWALVFDDRSRVTQCALSTSNGEWHRIGAPSPVAFVNNKIIVASMNAATPGSSAP
jgi:hypothetical protein